MQRRKRLILTKSSLMHQRGQCQGNTTTLLFLCDEGTAKIY